MCWSIRVQTAAGGRGRHCGKPAAVGESEEQRKPERFSGYRKADRGRFSLQRLSAAAGRSPGACRRPTSASSSCAGVEPVEIKRHLVHRHKSDTRRLT